MKKDSKKDSAVSPVIGTILLVAITVVLVAIISAVVMGMTGNVGQTHTVGLKVTGNATTAGSVDVLFTGGEYNLINGLKVNTQPITGTSFNLGQTYTASTVGTGNTDVNVIANFTDGSQQIIWSGKLNL